MTKVSQTDYANQYDLLYNHNPAYQDLNLHCLLTVKDWSLSAGEIVADIGAGTGILSVQIAKACPHLEILHLERDEAMNEVAIEKARRVGLTNWRVVPTDLDSHELKVPKLGGVVCIHSLYALKHPEEVIKTWPKTFAPEAISTPPTSAGGSARSGGLAISFGITGNQMESSKQ